MPSHSASRRSRLPLDGKRLAIIGGAVVVVVGVVLGVVLSSGGKKTPAGKSAPTSSAAAAPTSTQPALASNVCPLTDTPAPGGKVPQRAPIAVKIGNEPGPDAGGLGAARPQSGLNEADVVYDTPAEGGIMRYEAIYQCQDASMIGPVRSVRWVDWHILAEFHQSILVHVGGITPDISALDKLDYVIDGNAFTYPQDFVQTSNRTAPDNTYTSTQAIWKTFPKATWTPGPIFQYTASLPSSATPLSQVEINFSGGTDAVWKWSAAGNDWLHFWSSTPDIDSLTNKQVSTTNIVIQVVSYKYGPYAESPGSTGDVESITTGKGTGWVLRNGKMIPVIWHRARLQDPTTYTTTTGQKVGLAPGRTWVEMVLNTTAQQQGAITFTK